MLVSFGFGAFPCVLGFDLRFCGLGQNWPFGRAVLLGPIVLLGMMMPMREVGKVLLKLFFVHGSYRDLKSIAATRTELLPSQGSSGDPLLFCLFIRVHAKCQVQDILCSHTIFGSSGRVVLHYSTGHR
jgi:hypothetical protein